MRLRRQRANDDHGRAAVTTDEGMWGDGVVVGRGASVAFSRRWRFGVQQCACSGELEGATGVAEQAVVTDAMETARQHVQEEAPHELLRCESQGLVASAALHPVILPAESDAALVMGDQATVGDGDPMGVAGEIGEDRGGTGEGPLGIDNPLDLAQRREPPGKSRGIGELGVLAKELQLASGMSCGEVFEEAATEEAGEHPYRQEETRPAVDPPIPVHGDAAPRDDAVNVRSELRSSGVQHERRADAGTQMSRVGGDRAQCLGGDVEQ